jgi:ABC-2 type transport system permease protein
MNPRRLKALLLKESYQILRDPSAILIAVILPLILLFLMGYAVSLDSKRIPIGVVSSSQSDDARALVEAFQGSIFFVAETGTDERRFLERMQRGSLKGIVTLDPRFGEAGRYRVQILADGTEPNSAGFLQKYVSGVVQQWAAGLDPSGPAITVEPRYWFNPPVSSRYFLLPGSIAVVMTLIGILLTALVVAREWERGTMEAIMATPSSMIEIIVGKLIPYFVLGMGSMILCFFVAYFWYAIPFHGSLLILFVISAVYLFPALSIGLFISTVAKNQFVAAQAALLAGFLPAFLLSGFLFEIENMPQWLQVLTYAVPARYFVESLQTLFLAGDIYPLFLRDSAGMLAIGLFFFGLILKQSKKGLE